jgi:filamentous hemagglutinin family protein
MNKIYRLIWSELLQAWVCVSEHVRAHGKSVITTVMTSGALSLGMAYCAPASATPPPAFNQLPTGGQVVAGQSNIYQAGATMQITQQSPRSVIDWQTFNIGQQAHVNFTQPSGSAVSLNRVLDSDPSQIFGSLTANGPLPNWLHLTHGGFIVQPTSVDSLPLEVSVQVGNKQSRLLITTQPSWNATL